MMTTTMSKPYLTLNFTRACGVWCLLLLLACIVTSHAQEQSPKRGFNPGGSYAVSDIETISTTGGNLSLRVPVGGLPAGRGGMKASVNLVYNSKLWDTYPFNVPAPTEDVTDTDSWNETRLRQSDDGGWRYAFKYDLKLETRHLGSGTGYCQPDGGAAVVFVYKLFLTLPDGSKHEMHLGGLHTGDDGYTDIMPDGVVRYAPESPCPGTTPEYGTLTYYSGDATFLRLEIQHDGDENWENNPWTLYLPDGGRVTGGADNAPQRIYDRNNNYIEVIKTLNDQAYGGHTTVRLNDQVGRSVIVEYNSAPNQDSIHVRGTNNELVTTKVLWTNVQVNKSYQAGSPFTRIVARNMRVVSQIILPAQAGGLAYNFGYNAGTANPSYGWGEVSSVTLPSGAKASYQYLRDGANNIRSEHVLANHPTRKDLVYRREYDGTAVSNTPCNTQTEATCATETTTYGINFDAMGTVAQDGWVTAPDGGTTRDYVTPGGDVYKSERPDGTVVERQWQSNVPTGTLYASNNYVKREFTSIRDAAGNLTKTAIKEYNQDKNGNVTQAKEYDWVAYGSVTRDPNGRPNAVPGGAPLKRVTTSSYYYPTPDASDWTTNDPDAYYNSSAPRVRSAAAASEMSNGTQTLTRSEFFYDNAAAPTVGNLTVQKSWDSTKGASSNPLTTTNSVSTSTQYNAYGSPILTTDARGTQTEYTYGDVNGYTDLYPTIIKAAFGTTLQQVSTLAYDYYTGAVTRSVDPNNVATATTYDAFGRPTLVRAAEGIAAKETRTATEYLDANRMVIVRSDLTNAGDGKLVSIQHYDQLGRVRLSRRLENAATESETSETSGVKVQTRYLYSGSNSYLLVSNPYRAQYAHHATGEPSMGWTRSKADNSGRTVETQTFGGAALPAPWGANASSSGAVTTAYDAEFTTVTDQAGKVRRSMMSGLGQLARVDEPDVNTGSLGSTASPVQPTSYTYDALGNLTQVVQATSTVTQTRTFNYSSLSRLTSATNPESGTTSYTYDAGGNLLTKTDARAVTITYAYDALSRNTTADYSDTASINPDIQRFYDGAVNGKGRFWYQLKYGANNSFDFSAEDGYDALGRPYQHRQVFHTGGVSSPGFYTLRTYNRAGGVLTQTYPSGHTVTYNYDAAGRLGDNGPNLAFTGNLGDGTQRTYAAAIQYDEASRMIRERFGTETALYHKQRYNVRGQLYDVRLSSVDDADNWNRGQLLNHYSHYNGVWGAAGPDDNGNVLRTHHYIPNDEGVSSYGLFYQDYEYDALNRLKRVTEINNVAWAQQYVQAYDYDRWGNRQINAALTTDTINEKQFAVDTVTNRLGVPSGQLGTMTYDDAGNLTDDTYTGAGARIYDAENRMTRAAVPGTTYSESVYTYDADGRRVRRQTPSENVWQIYGIDGELIAEYAASAAPTAPQKEYGYRNGELLVVATAPASAGTNLAQGKTATQSSDAWGGVAPRAVDGNTSGNWNDASVTHTGTQNEAWWQVDLGSLQSLGELKLWNRTDCCGAALTNFYVFVSDNPFTSTSLAATQSQAGVTGYHVAGQGGTPTTVAANRTGRYVRVQLVAYERLSLAEVQIFAAAGGAQPVSWQNVVGVTASGNSLTKHTGWGWGTGASSVQTIAAGDGHVEFTVGLSTDDVLCGLSFGDANGSYEDIDFAIYASHVNAQTLFVHEGGVNKGAFGTFAAGDRFRVAVEGGVVKYYRVVGGVATLFYTSGGSVQYPLLADTALHNQGDQLTNVVLSGGAGSGAGGGVASINWLVTDHLGTPRMVADQTGSLAGIKRHDYLPFGEELFAGTGGRTSGQGYAGDNVRQQFTGYERDDETGLDFAQNRYYSAVMGRFTSPDEPFADQHVEDPQSWNLYTYTRNNPLRYTDPDGRGIFGDLWQRLKNWEYGFRTDEQVQQLEDKWRNYLREQEKAAGGNLINCPLQGQCQKVNIDNLSRNDVFRHAADLKESIQNGTVQNYTPEQVQEIVGATTPAPGLKGDPYSPDEVTKRQNTELKDLRQKMQSLDRSAERLGFNRTVKDAPFNSHGQKVFSDGKGRFITRDVDRHSGGAWKMFDRSGNRLGTYDANLNRIGN